MKKKLFLVIIAAGFAISLFAQTYFDNGFRAGYKEGYCHDKGMDCMPPIPPIPPIPQVNESSNSYQDGYNRGFRMGVQANSGSNQNSTRQFYSMPKPEFVDDFVFQPDYNLIQQVMNKRQSLYNTNRELCTNLMNWIDELKRQTNDAQLLAYLNNYQNNFRQSMKTINYDYSLIVTWSIRHSFDEVSNIVNTHLERIRKENDPVRYWEMANKYYEKKEYQSAIDNYNKVIQLASDYAPAYLYRGISYYNLKNYSAAIRDYSKCAQLEPQEFLAYANRGYAYYIQENYKDAISDFSKCLQLKKDEISVLLMFRTP